MKSLFSFADDNSSNSGLLNLFTDSISSIPSAQNNRLTDKDSVVNLKEVTVVSANRTADVEKITIIPEKSLLKHNASSLGVLKDLMLPGLNVNTIMQSADIYGKSVLFKINGIPKSIQSIPTLSPSEIAKVEYSNTVSIKDATSNIGGTINFILKEKLSGGTVYNSLYSAVTTGMINENAEITYNNRASQFALNYNMQWRGYSKSFSDSYTEYLAGTQSTIRESKGLMGDLNMCLNNLAASYTLTPSKNTVLSLSLGYFFGPWKKTTENDNTQTVGLDKATSLFKSARKIDQPYSIPSVDLFLKHTFKNKSQLEFTSVTAYNHSDNLWQQTYIYPDKKTVDFVNDVTGKQWTTINELYFTKRIKGYNIKLGVKDTYTHSSNLYRSNDTFSKTDLKENVLFAYAELGGRIRALSYTLGTGIYYEDIRQTGFTNRNFLKNYSILRWMVSPVGKFSFNGAVKLSPELPSITSMDNVFMRIDDLNANIGNPTLSPSLSLAGDLNISFSHGPFSTYLRVISKPNVEADYFIRLFFRQSVCDASN